MHVNASTIRVCNCTVTNSYCQRVPIFITSATTFLKQCCHITMGGLDHVQGDSLGFRVQYFLRTCYRGYRWRIESPILLPQLPRFTVYQPNAYYTQFAEYPLDQLIYTITFGELFSLYIEQFPDCYSVRISSINIYLYDRSPFRSGALGNTFEFHTHPATVIFYLTPINSSGIFFRLDTLQVNRVASGQC